MATEKQSGKINGGARKGAGRPAGTPNRVTIEFRDTVRRVLEDNSENVGVWLSQVANGVGDKPPAPDKALDLLAKLAEFAAPKLNRTEHANADGESFKLVSKVQFEIVNT
jgi:hypothetical protein